MNREKSNFIFLVMMFIMIIIPIKISASTYKYSDIKHCYFTGSDTEVEKTKIKKTGYLGCLQQNTRDKVDKDKLLSSAACEKGYELYSAYNPILDEQGEERASLSGYGCRKEIQGAVYCTYGAPVGSYNDIMLMYVNNNLKLREIDPSYGSKKDGYHVPASYDNKNWVNSDKDILYTPPGGNQLFKCPQYVREVMNRATDETYAYEFSDECEDQDNGWCSKLSKETIIEGEVTDEEIKEEIIDDDDLFKTIKGAEAKSRFCQTKNWNKKCTYKEDDSDQHFYIYLKDDDYTVLADSAIDKTEFQIYWSFKDFMALNNDDCPENIWYYWNGAAYLYPEDINDGLHVRYKATLTENTDDFEADYERCKSEEYEGGEPVYKCEVIPEEIRKWIVNILKFIRYVALALVVALGALDFMKAAGSGEADAMKKAGQTFMKRLIAVAILFLLPVIVDFILNMVNLYGVDPNNVDCLQTPPTQ